LKLKTLSVLLVLLSLGFATAPSWIAQGASLNYTSGTTSVSFLVTGVSGSNINIALTTAPPSATSNIVENATAESGQFWFDNSITSHAYEGELVNGLDVVSTGPQTFAGQSWNAVTLQGMVSDGMGNTVETTYIYDEQTGLLLEQTVDASGVPNVVLSQYYIPALVPPPQNVTPPQQNTTVAPEKNTTSAVTPPPAPQENSTNNSSVVSQTTQPVTTEPTETSTDNAGDQGSSPTGQSSSSSLPCCPSAFILLLAGFVAIKAR
jgi:hypothetical protein